MKLQHLCSNRALFKQCDCTTCSSVPVTIILQASLSLLSSLIYQSITLVSIRLLQPGRLSSAISDVSLSCWLVLICCSLVVLSSAVSDASQSLKALKPGLPLLSSLGYQSLVLVSTHRLQLGRPLLGSLGYQSLVLVSRLICCSLAALSSAVSDASRSVNLCSLASLASAVSDASLSLLVPRI